MTRPTASSLALQLLEAEQHSPSSNSLRWAEELLRPTTATNTAAAATISRSASLQGLSLSTGGGLGGDVGSDVGGSLSDASSLPASVRRPSFAFTALSRTGLPAATPDLGRSGSGPSGGAGSLAGQELTGPAADTGLAAGNRPSQVQPPQHGQELVEGASCNLREATLIDASSQTTTTPLMDLSWTFQLHSSASSSKVIYLDFDGHTTTGTSWNTSTMGSSFYSPAYDIDGNPASFSTEELSRIQQIWQRVAADYAPFDVDVTTQAPPTDWLLKSGSTDTHWGMRAVITGYGPSSSTVGGIASVNSFNASTDTPCFIYNKSLTGVAEAISHEVGHSLGLSHDGTSSSAYYYGHGSGETSWAPIMGVGYNKNVTQWDNGTYYGSNNKSSSANYGHGPDDMKVISTYNGFGFKADQVGDSVSTASQLTISSGQVGQFGRIETTTDVDCYSFQLQSNGDLNLSFNPYWYRAEVDRDGVWGGSTLSWTAPVSDGNGSTAYADSGTNLDLAVGLYSSTGLLLGSVDGAGLATTLAWSNLAAGSYYLKLDGVGTGNPTSSTPSGYSDYGSVGNYWISGTISGAADSTSGTQTTTTSTTSTTSSTTSSGGTAATPISAATLQQFTAAGGTGALQQQAHADPLTGLQAGAAGRLSDSLLGSAAAGLLSGQALAGASLTGAASTAWAQPENAALAPLIPASADLSGGSLLGATPWSGSQPQLMAALESLQRSPWPLA